MKVDNSNESFLKSLILIASVTLISMGTARYFISHSSLVPQKTQSFTSQQPQISSVGPQ